MSKPTQTLQDFLNEVSLSLFKTSSEDSISNAPSKPKLRAKGNLEGTQKRLNELNEKRILRRKSSNGLTPYKKEPFWWDSADEKESGKEEQKPSQYIRAKTNSSPLLASRRDSIEHEAYQPFIKPSQIKVPSVVFQSDSMDDIIQSDVSDVLIPSILELNVDYDPVDESIHDDSALFNTTDADKQKFFDALRDGDQTVDYALLNRELDSSDDEELEIEGEWLKEMKTGKLDIPVEFDSLSFDSRSTSIEKKAKENQTQLNEIDATKKDRDHEESVISSHILETLDTDKSSNMPTSLDQSQVASTHDGKYEDNLINGGKHKPFEKQELILEDAYSLSFESASDIQNEELDDASILKDTMSHMIETVNQDVGTYDILNAVFELTSGAEDYNSRIGEIKPKGNFQNITKKQIDFEANPGPKFIGDEVAAGFNSPKDAKPVKFDFIESQNLCVETKDVDSVAAQIKSPEIKLKETLVFEETVKKSSSRVPTPQKKSDTKVLMNSLKANTKSTGKLISTSSDSVKKNALKLTNEKHVQARKVKLEAKGNVVLKGNDTLPNDPHIDADVAIANEYPKEFEVISDIKITSNKRETSLAEKILRDFAETVSSQEAELKTQSARIKFLESQNETQLEDIDNYLEQIRFVEAGLKDKQEAQKKKIIGPNISEAQSVVLRKEINEQEMLIQGVLFSLITVSIGK